MERKFLEDMGLDKEQVNQIMKQYGQDISSYKDMQTQIDALTAERDSYKNQSDATAKQLKDLQGELKDNADATATIEDLQKQLKDQKKQAQATLLKVKKDNAINNAISAANVHDIKAIMPYLNTDAITYNDNGLTGLSDQLDKLKADKPFLFKQVKETPKEAIQATAGQPTKINEAQTIDLKHASYSELAKLKQTDPAAFQALMAGNK